MTEEKVISNSEDGGGSRFNELCPSNASLHQSHTGSVKLPSYDVLCRHRLARKKRKYAAQFNRELNRMIAMKIKAVDGIRLDLLFSTDE